ncbi:MAG: excinuclease ABC subunit UvrA [Nitrospirae bacterium]|nr:excinuclease ABC subunit UvrA [Nitrospirota bacterium]
MDDFIIIKGAREHNLKNIDLRLPRNSIIVITGPSGSGKSSLAIDTIYAEGQRRFVQSLSSYARQFIGELQKPDVDYIEGLSPSVSIEQKTVSGSPRSTLGTITEIYDYMRVLYTRIGKPFCYNCGNPISSQDTEGIISSILSLSKGTRLQILSPIVQQRKGLYRKELEQMRREGFIRARVDGKMMDLTEDIKLNKHKRHTIEIVIDRLIVKDGIERQLKNSINVALRYADTVVINLVDENRDILFSKTLACTNCGISYPEINPMFFSFNSSVGACPKCKGIGYTNIYDEEGAFEGVEDLKPCNECGGMRLRKESLGIKIGGLSIGEFSSFSVDDALEFLNELKLSERESFIASRILKEVKERLSFLKQVGVGYLTLDRPAVTLSGGEAQRVRLATQLGSSLTGVLYVLDEPSIGLHPRDCNRLINTLKKLRDSENTIVIVEHDEETIKSADFIVDLGPGGGVRGGWVVATGTPEEISTNPESLTGQFLSGKKLIPIPVARRKPTGYITLYGINKHNLKNLDVSIPLGVFVCVTGVSGSGKSTLVFDVLYRTLINEMKNKKGKRSVKNLTGLEQISHVICLEQKPLGRTPRSNPVTYTGVFTHIRNLFAMTEDARTRGFNASRFSFNLTGGRCEACKGEGFKKIEMHFLPDVYVPCDSCGGKRYNYETLQIKFKGKSIADILDMTISEAYDFFIHIPALRDRLKLLVDVGLGYIQLGQSATTLSGGEAQRIRLAKELGKKTGKGTLYILDEPTTGLHFIDIQRLIDVINRLVDKGNTVLVIEHNLDIIKSADYIIDLGPEGGLEGGRIVAQGTPEEISNNPNSHTGLYLKEKLQKENKDEEIYSVYN